MADSKITALAALTAADPVNDMFPVVDVSDTSMAASGTTKRISANNILSSSPTASGALTVTGLVTAGSTSITGAATVGTTLGVTGASTLASVGVTGAATVGTTLLVGTNATLTNGNVIIGTSGKGIDFSATANSSGTMTSELLNDYEEGTFTPTFTASAGTPTTVTLNTAYYTKIGRRVSIDLDFVITNVGTASSQLRFTLPFNQIDPAGPCGVFKEVNVTNYAGTFAFVDDTRVGVNFYDGSTVWVNTYRLRGTYTYNV